MGTKSGAALAMNGANPAILDAPAKLLARVGATAGSLFWSGITLSAICF